jgi:hypothetical protein
MHLPPINLNWRALRELALYAAVLILPGGSLIALGMWIFGRRGRHGSAGDAVAVQSAMGVQPAFIAAPGARTVDAGDLDAHLFV